MADQIDLVAPLPSSFSGAVTVRVIDTNRESGMTDLDTVSLDTVFIRTVE